jgi:sigma-E factor negative regulatory protein RseC
MKETGRVLAVAGDAVTVLQDASAACFGCMNQECRQKQGIITAENKTGLPLKAGQLVETEFPLTTALAQGVSLFALPFLACAAVYLASGFLSPALGEPVRAALGAAALFAAGIALYFYRRKHPFKTRPVIAGVLSDP